MSNFFDKFTTVQYKGPESTNPFSFRYYNPQEVILGKTMAEHLRLSVCFWHNFCWQGNDNFGEATFDRAWMKFADPMAAAHAKITAGFEFLEKINVPYFTFHDRDVSPEGNNLRETQTNLDKVVSQIAKEMERTGKQLLWGTANLFSHRRYLAGAATNPNPEIFAYAVAQVKSALDATHQLRGHNYVLWGGREGYETLLNTDMKQECEQLARFLTMLVEYKHQIGFKGTLLIEPKPCEPTKHQYDFDSAHVYAFLQRYGLEKEFKVNIEVNHATLAGHSFRHEVEYACTNDIFGSIDANRGDPQLGWDTDQFPTDIKEMTLAMYFILKHGGFTSGGFNFDTKLRRQSIDLDDLFYGHICGIDTLACALRKAAKMIEQKTIQSVIDQRYAGWQQSFGQQILNGQLDFATIAKQALDNNLDPQPVSGRQELLEHTINYI